MAYPTCPGCLMPQLVRDDADRFSCFNCASRVIFATCSHCGLVQTALVQWPTFTCGRCEREVGPPTGGAVPAARAQGVGRPGF